MELVVNDNEAEQIALALTAVGRVALATKVNGQIDVERRHRDSVKRAEEALAELRAKRAADAMISRRQALCLAAVRAGKFPYQWWEDGH